MSSEVPVSNNQMDNKTIFSMSPVDFQGNVDPDLSDMITVSTD